MQIKNIIKYAAVGVLVVTTAAYAAPPLEMKTKADFDALNLSYKLQLSEMSEHLVADAIQLSRAGVEIARLQDEMAKRPPAPAPAPAPAINAPSP